MVLINAQSYNRVAALLKTNHVRNKYLCRHNYVSGVLRGSVVKGRTREQEIPGSSLSGFTRLFVGVSVGKTLHSHGLVLVKSRDNMDF